MCLWFRGIKEMKTLIRLFSTTFIVFVSLLGASGGHGRELRKKHKKPFFKACGMFHPHMPWCVPQKYLNMYPLDSIVEGKAHKGNPCVTPQNGEIEKSDRFPNF